MGLLPDAGGHAQLLSARHVPGQQADRAGRPKRHRARRGADRPRPGQDAGAFVVIDKQDEVAGFVRGRVLPKGGLGDFLEYRLPEIPEDLHQADAEGALGVVQTVVVGRTGARPCGRRTCRGLKHSSRARGRKGDSDVPLRVPRAATQSVICSSPDHRPRVSR